MTFHIISLFPEFASSVFSFSIIKRAIDKKIIKFHYLNPRDFATDRHRSVDDKPYGGGKGMIMRVDILVSTLESISATASGGPDISEERLWHGSKIVPRRPADIKPKPYSILLAASGKKYTQNYAFKLAKLSNIALVCGHYEGVDARVEEFVDEVFSIGDFVLTGGEIAAAAIVDSVTRLIPGVIQKESLAEESFIIESQKHKLGGILEYPHYTRPEEFRGLKVPQVLMSGNHREIESWRQKEATKRTRKYRPDLLLKVEDGKLKMEN